jgi:hypothetical protein
MQDKRGGDGYDLGDSLGIFDGPGALEIAGTLAASVPLRHAIFEILWIVRAAGASGTPILARANKYG